MHIVREIFVLKNIHVENFSRTAACAVIEAFNDSDLAVLAVLSLTRFFGKTRAAADPPWS